MDESELEAFCRREYPRLVGALSLYIGDQAVAEEIAQDTLARICADWPSVRTKRSSGAWTHRVAMNLAKSHLRRGRIGARVTAQAVARQPHAHHDPDSADRLSVQQALVALNERQRAVIVCRYYLQMSVTETATAVRVPEGTVKSDTSRALAQLRAQLDFVDDSEGVQP